MTDGARSGPAVCLRPLMGSLDDMSAAAGLTFRVKSTRFSSTISRMRCSGRFDPDEYAKAS
jgi:hypothetical protein